MREAGCGGLGRVREAQRGCFQPGTPPRGSSPREGSSPISPACGCWVPVLTPSRPLKAQHQLHLYSWFPDFRLPVRRCPPGGEHLYWHRQVTFFTFPHSATSFISWQTQRVGQRALRSPGNGPERRRTPSLAELHGPTCPTERPYGSSRPPPHPSGLQLESHAPLLSPGVQSTGAPKTCGGMTEGR